jgi:hypothetical protein
MLPSSQHSTSPVFRLQQGAAQALHCDVIHLTACPAAPLLPGRGGPLLFNYELLRLPSLASQDLATSMIDELPLNYAGSAEADADDVKRFVKPMCLSAGKR